MDVVQAIVISKLTASDDSVSHGHRKAEKTLSPKSTSKRKRQDSQSNDAPPTKRKKSPMKTIDKRAKEIYIEGFESIQAVDKPLPRGAHGTILFLTKQPNPSIQCVIKIFFLAHKYAAELKSLEGMLFFL